MYEINRSTLALIPIDFETTEIIESHQQKIVNLKVKALINNSCRYFGSSYEGRLSGTKKILGISYKAPIIIEESDNIIFFPTKSPRTDECIWLSLKHIKDYKKTGKKTTITFINDKQIYLDISYNAINNQILKAARLQMLLQNRKLNKK